MAISNAKKIAKNTLMLYFRQIIILFVSLYTVRVVLNELGTVDYGIYNVVGGIVTFFSFLSGTMASATQRFFSFALGAEDEERLYKTFSVNLIIYTCIAFFALILLETIGLWFVSQKLNIPSDRNNAVQLVFQFSIFTFLTTIISSPLMAIIIAHEDMQIYAGISIVEAILRLGTALLLKINYGDKLIEYGLLLLIVSCITTCVYFFVCKKKYKECQFKKLFWDKNIFNEIISFTGWTLFGSLSNVGRTQAVTVLMNQFFGPVIVSARTIAVNVSNHLNVFSTNFNTSLYPSIIKSYAANKLQEMYKFVFFGCKLTFFLMWIFGLPLFLEMDFVLTIWLKNVPENAIFFTRLALIESLISSISLPISTAARAPGKMRTYELSLGFIQFLIFFVDFILFYFFHVSAYFVFIVAAGGNLIMFFVRLVIVKHLINFPVKNFLKQDVIPILFVSLISFIPSYFIKLQLSESIINSLLIIFLSVIISISIMFILGISRSEKQFLLNKLKRKV